MSDPRPDSPRRPRPYGLASLVHCRSHFGPLYAIAGALGARVKPLRGATAALQAALEHYTDQRSRAFDRRFGTETFERKSLADLGVDARSGYDFEGWSTGPVNQAFFRELIRNTPVNPRDYVFLDVGSGKGKAIMLATEYPFRRIVGVELSAELTETARRNLGSYLARRGRASSAEILCQDFMQYPLPAEPSVLFFNSPFPLPIADLALRHVEASLERDPRPMFVLYRKPSLGVWERLASSPRLERVRVTPYWAIYRSRVG